MDVDTALTEPQRVQDLWFEDGNIVIQAGNSQFRVFRGILAARSPVFEDMFSLPQPADSEAVDGCPCFRFFKPYPYSTEFNIIFGCLRLGQKYEVDSLRRRALVHFSSRYATSLSEYVVPQPSWNREHDAEGHIEVIQLARVATAPWILPLAFYELSSSYSDDGDVTTWGFSMRFLTMVFPIAYRHWIAKIFSVVTMVKAIGRSHTSCDFS
ncbi:hypothetical protein C8R43DRAFT_1131078 [Mycena crocata]|nr:hypothetical protein C8R43DRAFT_1131078 [Mycena crocata]